MKVETKIAIETAKYKAMQVVLWGLGVITGLSIMYGAYEAPKLFESHTITIERSVKHVEAVEAVKVETVEEEIRRVAKDFPAVDTLVKIAFCESSLDRLAENKASSAKGIFQILDMHGLTAVERFNVETATKWAIAKATKDGFKAWNESKHCWSK